MNLIEILLGVAFPVLIGIGFALSLGGVAATEFWVARIAFIAAALDVSGLIVWWLYNSAPSRWKTPTGILIAGLSVVALPVILRWIDTKEASATEQPDVTLRFVYSQTPALQLVNISDKTAREIKFMVAVWNIDLPNRHDPLPIPVSTADFLKAREVTGPMAVFTSPLVTPLVHAGNRLFGSASVSCSECSRGRTFIVSIVWGEGGWFAELPEEKSGGVTVPRHFTTEAITAYFNEFPKKIPPQSRIPIGDDIN